MTAIVLLVFGAIVAMALFLAALSIAGLLLAAARAEKRERAAAMAEHVDQALDVARAQPIVPPTPAIVAGSDLAPDHGDPAIAEAHRLYDAYRRGIDPGGEPELSPLSRWTEKGWRPIRDWRLATDKRWW